MGNVYLNLLLFFGSTLIYLDDSWTSPNVALYNTWKRSHLVIASPPLSDFLISFARSIRLIASSYCVLCDLINSSPNIILEAISAVSCLEILSNGLSLGPAPINLKSLARFA